MEERYRSAIEAASACLSQALLEDKDTLLKHGFRLDALVRDLLRVVALAVLKALYEGLCRHLVHQARRRGLEVQSRQVVRFKTLFGELEVESPYLWSRSGQESSRPLKDYLGIEGGHYSVSVQRALVDFGSEKSFSRAAKSFQEHYGFEVGRTTLRTLTLEAAKEAESSMALRVEEGKAAYEASLFERPGVPELLVELDGCDIRTGIVMRACEAGLLDRPAHKRVRQENWREVRTGLVGPLESRERLYACRLDSYGEVCEQLFGLACLEGLTSGTQVVAPGDGAGGLREALMVPFPKAQYILDHPHLKSHVYETAEALGMTGKKRHEWVSEQMQQLWSGQVKAVLKNLKRRDKRTPHERLGRLIEFVERFKDCVHYGDYKARGWPIGSGEVESAHRYVPQERLKIAGACWHPDNVNPMLSLRVIRANDWWDEFWQWRLQKRQEQSRA